MINVNRGNYKYIFKKSWLQNNHLVMVDEFYEVIDVIEET